MGEGRDNNTKKQSEQTWGVILQGRLKKAMGLSGIKKVGGEWTGEQMVREGEGRK